MVVVQLIGSYGLHTQCQNQIIDNRKYCFKCKLKKEGNKFIGDIEERLKCKTIGICR